MVLPLLLVLSVAGALRAGYVAVCANQGRQDGPVAVQGAEPLSHYPPGTTFRGKAVPTQLDNLVANVTDHSTFGCLAPLADEDEPSAHVAPGFPWLHGFLAKYTDSADLALRWLNVVLGALTAGCYFFFAHRAFRHVFVAMLAGLLAACWPFWIANTTELNDGVIAGFVLSLCLMFGARAGQTGGLLTGLLFGLSLAALILIRAAMLPFALGAMLWFLWQCRNYSLGWCAGVLALIGLLNGILPWGIRNYQEFGRPIPVADSTYLHLWMGNNPAATGATLDEPALRASLREERLTQLLGESNQAVRYQTLSRDVLDEAIAHPDDTLARRIKSALVFALGHRWFTDGRFAVIAQEDDTAPPLTSYVREHADLALQIAFIAMAVLALLGFRLGMAWRQTSRLATIAVILIPLPYVLSHAEMLSGPRLPLDGVLLCFAALGLASFIPGVVQPPATEKPKSVAQ